MGDFITLYQRLSQMRGTRRNTVGQAFWHMTISMPITVKSIASDVLMNNGMMKSTMD